MKTISIISALLTLVISSTSYSSTQNHNIIINGHSAKISATSELIGKTKHQYAVTNIFDDDISTAWVEGVQGDGIGESITIEFDEPIMLYGMMLLPGYQKSDKTLIQNSSPSKLSIKLDDQTYTTNVLYSKEFDFESEKCLLTADKINYSPRLFQALSPRKIKKLQIEVLESVSGSRYNDLAISELKLLTSNEALFNSKIINVKEVVKNNKDAIAVFETETGWITNETKDLTKVLNSNNNNDTHFFHESAPTSSNFTQVLEQFFYNNFITVYNELYISPEYEKVGDGEWVEIYRTVEVKDKIINKFKYNYTIDGSPGCTPNLEQVN